MTAVSPFAAQERATRTLIKFCEDHHYDSQYLLTVKNCLSHLENGERQLALEAYQKVPLGRNGCFNDWWPPVLYSHENEEYVWGVFEALVSNWSRLMSTLQEHRQE